MGRVYKGVANSGEARRGAGKEIAERKRNEMKIQKEHADKFKNDAEEEDLDLNLFTDSNGQIDEVKLEKKIENFANSKNVDWNNATDEFLERAEHLLIEMQKDDSSNENLQKAWMEVSAVIDFRERMDTQVNTARAAAETIAQAQMESPEAAELAQLKNELTERRNEMQDLAAALGWKKMFNGQYRSLTREVKNLEQAVTSKEQQVPQQTQKAA